MPIDVQISIPATEINNLEFLKSQAAHQANLPLNKVSNIVFLRKNIDARSHLIKYILKVRIFLTTENYKPINYKDLISNNNVKKQPEIHIVGLGPAGLFAAVKAIELGLKPLVFERGKEVKNRRRDLANLIKNGQVNPNSNYCFGEGGAGTYSDGKLFTRSKKRGNQQEILDKLVAFGASHDILFEAHPHIGTNKLPKIIENIRNYILTQGGEIHFNSRVSDILTENNKIQGIEVENTSNGVTSKIPVKYLVLATGHSARDIFKLLENKKITVHFKPFALGVRVEHPQNIIDSMQYHCSIDKLESIKSYLPPASYSWVKQIDGKGVYSFCMCPGGIIAPCATENNQVVTNGWSPSKRNNATANSGIVVEIEETDLKQYKNYGPLAGMIFQQNLEYTMWKAGGENQSAPAQRLIDFINEKTSETLPHCSYLSGVKSANVAKLLPKFITKRLQKAFVDVGKSLKGYLTNEAVVVAVESRTSSPIKIPRNPETMEHITVSGLFPIGEGAGYAGGIISAAMDGSNAIEKIAQLIKEHK